MLRHRRIITVGALALVVEVALVALVFFGGNLQQWRTGHVESQAQACGALTYAAGRLTTATTEAQRAEACFFAADTHCRVATLSASVMGVDTGTHDTFLIQPPLGPFGACQIVLSVTHYGLISMPNRTETATCGGVALSPTRMTVSACGAVGDVTLPSTQGAPW
jgi:hypothetical protein